MGYIWSASPDPQVITIGAHTPWTQNSWIGKHLKRFYISIDGHMHVLITTKGGYSALEYLNLTIHSYTSKELHLYIFWKE